MLISIIENSYACPMTTEQVKTIENISIATNVSNSTLQSLFSILCDKYNKTETDSRFYNNSQIDMKFKDYYNITEIKGNWTVFNDTWNTTVFRELESTRLEINDFTTRFINAYNETLGSNVVRFEDQLGEKIAAAKNFAATKEELNQTKTEVNYTINTLFEQMSSNVVRYVDEKASPWRYAMWGFSALSLAMLGVAYLFTHKPTFHRPRVIGIPISKHSSEELVTDTQLKNIVKLRRELRYEAVKLAKPEFRDILFKKIDNDEINNIDELKMEIDILHGVVRKDLEDATTAKNKRRKAKGG